MSYMPVRGGTRGGKDQFQWDDVKVDKHRESYLGHSLMAPVGRWQKGKDLTWYNKKSKVMGQNEMLRAEIAAVKRAEEDAMAAALGLKPKGASLGSGSVSKQELAEVCRRQSVEEKEETGEERMQGLGFASHRLSHLYSNQASATGSAMFESKPIHDGDGAGVSAVSTQPSTSPPRSSHPPPSSSHLPPTKRARLDREPIWVEKTSDVSSKHHSKEKKKKRKKERAKKKHKKERKRRHDSSSSESEEEAGRERVRQKGGCDSSDSEKERSSRHQRHKEDISGDSEARRHHRDKRESIRELDKGGSLGRRQKERDQERQRKPQRSRHHRHDSSSD